jgi:hypothetical protein
LKGLFSLIGCQQVKDLMRLALQEGLDAIVYLGVALRTLKPLRHKEHDAKPKPTPQTTTKTTAISNRQ